MRWILWTVVGLIALVGVVTLIGWLLPVAHLASSSARVGQPPEAAYAAIADVGNYSAWLEGTSRVDMLDGVGGKVRFRQHSTTGPIVMEVGEANPRSRFVTRIADREQPFGGTWTFELTPESGGTRVTITENGEIYNPIVRFMARFVFGYAGTMEGYLRSLSRKLGT